MKKGKRPNYTCHNIQKDHLPYAHILAVIQQKASWCDLPAVYRDHSYFILDEGMKNNLFKEPVLDEMLQNEGKYLREVIPP